MELKQYIKIIKRHIKSIVMVSILVGFFALIFSAVKPVTYETSLSLLISRATAQETQDYKYDSYYAIQANDLFANTIVGWLKSPEIVVDIYKEAGVNFPVKNLRKTTIIGRISQEEIVFSVIGSDPVIVEKKPNLILNTTVGVISGLLLGILIIFGKEYFKTE